MDKETILQIIAMLEKKISDLEYQHYQSLGDIGEYNINYNYKHYFEFNILKDVLGEIELIRFENKKVIGE
jgi:regulator of replication initiation timing